MSHADPVAPAVPRPTVARPGSDGLAEGAWDVVVVGSGAAGMTCAITAAHHGLSVIVLEKDALLGGTAARSGGWLWVPGNRGPAADGDSREAVQAYLDHVSGGRADTERVSAYLDATRPMLDFFERATQVEVDYREAAPDYVMDAPGARSGGRAVAARPFDARGLGPNRLMLQVPLKEMTVLGVMPQIGPDLDHFIKANRSLRSFAYMLRRLATNAAQRARHGRGLQLSNGSALAGRLLASAAEAGVELRSRCEVTALDVNGERVVGVCVAPAQGADQAVGTVEVRARLGVVLACGGISHDLARRQRAFSHDATLGNHVSAVVESDDGAAARLAERVDAAFDADVEQPAAWAPVTVFRGPLGRQRIFPHLRGMGLPGIIAVNRHGQRFTNESNSYHDFGQALVRTNLGEPGDIAWLICDARTMHRYGIGYAKPWPMPRARYLWNGYLTKARTPDELARAIGVDPEGFVQTLGQWNPAARRGEDPVFGRGATEYNFFRGDRTHEPNPCLAPVEQPPFYAVRVGMSDLGAFAGLRTDAAARVVSHKGSPVEGLHAVGSAASSPFGGAYPGYGAMLGPGMVFGYIAARALSSQADRAESPRG